MVIGYFHYFSPNNAGRNVESDGKSMVMRSATNMIAMNGAIDRDIFSREILAMLAIT